DDQAVDLAAVVHRAEVQALRHVLRADLVAARLLGPERGIAEAGKVELVESRRLIGGADVGPGARRRREAKAVAELPGAMAAELRVVVAPQARLELVPAERRLVAREERIHRAV